MPPALKKQFFKKSLALIAILALVLAFFIYEKLSKHLEIATFLNISVMDLGTECSRERYGITKDNSLQFCLHKDDHAKRCEIAIHNLEPAPQTNRIDFSFRLNGDLINPDHFFAILQIHGLPDQGEDWRCPNFTYDIMNGYMSIYNRWDALPMSKTVNGTCLGKGNSIKGRSLLPEKQEVAEGRWYNIALETALSYEKDGHITLDFADIEPQEFSGATMYNDERMPYLKLGVYKPTPWTHGQEEICVEYKDVELGSLSAR